MNDTVKTKEINDLRIAYHIIRNKPVMKEVSFGMREIGGKPTYWIKFCDQFNVSESFLKENYYCIANYGE
jgi:hypothetical protein